MLIISMFHGVRGVPRAKMERFAAWNLQIRRKGGAGFANQNSLIYGCY